MASFLFCYSFSEVPTVNKVLEESVKWGKRNCFWVNDYLRAVSKEQTFHDNVPYAGLYHSSITGTPIISGAQRLNPLEGLRIPNSRKPLVLPISNVGEVVLETTFFSFFDSKNHPPISYNKENCNFGNYFVPHPEDLLLMFPGDQGVVKGEEAVRVSEYDLSSNGYIVTFSQNIQWDSGLHKTISLYSMRLELYAKVEFFV